jgi:hypothetical protein
MKGMSTLDKIKRIKIVVSSEDENVAVSIFNDDHGVHISFVDTLNEMVENAEHKPHILGKDKTIEINYHRTVYGNRNNII